MTPSHVSTRFGALVGAALTTSLLLFAAPQAHAANGPYYKVELAQPATAEKQLLRGVFVKCEGASCRAPEASTAPKIMCVTISRKIGEVSAFSAGDRVFDATEIAACNEKTKGRIANN
ncbi:MAG: hypothetical protein ABI668_16455 [Sphingorhabdus sp.]